METATCNQFIPEIKKEEWFQLVLITKGPSADTGAAIYLNGGETSYELTNQAVGTRNEEADGDLRINSLTYPAAVYVDELTFWNRALSAKEVETLYNEVNIGCTC